VTILEAARQIRDRSISSIQLTENALSAISEQNPKINAFISVFADAARNRARQLDSELAQGRNRGFLHGIPVALKDLFHMKGVATTGGSKLFSGQIAGHDSAVTERLEAAGAIIVGKTNLHEMAYGVTSSNPHFGPVRNPHALDRIPGGSSGGSGAAIAAGIVPMAMGTDTGGSIRIPAAYCGTAGIKPTYGLVSRYGCLPLGLTLDHMGPLGRTVRDCAITLNVLAGYDPRDPHSDYRPAEDYFPEAKADIRGLRIGWPENYYFDGVEPEIRSSVEKARDAAAGLGARIVPVRVPEIKALNTVSRLILLAEASTVLEPYLHRRDQFGPDVLALLDQGRLLAATDYVNAQRLRGLFQQQFRDLFEHIDCLFTPTVPIGAPRIGQKTVIIDGGEEDTRLASTRFVRAINVLGLPAISIPCGRSSEGLPASLQIVGGPFAERMLLRTAAALEDAMGLIPIQPAK
jgi:aspartyl-tRNA(Asn)/glutamyl-tRNA(Gln) amidotransferase subunit A